MKFSLIIPFSLAALAVASPFSQLEPRKVDNSAAIVKDVKAIGAAIKTLNSTLNTFKPNDFLGFVKAIQIQQQTGDLEDAIKAATADTQASKKFKDGGESVSIEVLKLVPQIRSVLNNIVKHKPAFASAVLIVGDLSKTVEESLVSQKTLTSAFGKALIAKLSDPYKGLAPSINAQILSYFNKAIEAYKNCSGLVCLPPLPDA